MRYCKTIQLSDYQLSDTFQHVANMQGILSGLYTGWGTEHRRWEYGMTLAALRENGAKTVLEVGGGSSMLAACAVWMGLDVTVVDPEDYSAMFRSQSDRIGKNIPFIHSDFFDYPVDNQFDAVTCVSVIEHVDEDAKFFSKLLRHVRPSGLLCLTTDFHPSGKALFGGHLRCYNAEMMRLFIDLVQDQRFQVFGEEPDYDAFEPLVHGMYTFGSLVLKRNDS